MAIAASAILPVFVLVLSMFFQAIRPARLLAAEEEDVVLRVCSWEEYIDLGDW